MKNTTSETATTPEIYKVGYTIQDGEYEYGDYFVLKSDWDSVQEKAYEKLAEFFGYDEKEEKEIIAELKTEDIAMIGNRAIKDISINVVEAVTIIMQGGVIQDILNIPEGGVIKIKDYDTEGIPENELEKDDDGNPYVVSVWEGVILNS